MADSYFNPFDSVMIPMDQAPTKATQEQQLRLEVLKLFADTVGYTETQYVLDMAEKMLAWVKNKAKDGK